MQLASRYNKQRFHHGFHYPRSQKTLNEISVSRESFEKFYGKDIFGKTKNYYGLVEKNGKTKKNELLKYIKDVLTDKINNLENKKRSLFTIKILNEIEKQPLKK